ncbi:unnamed protein product [Paramecium octaurelia]|uniref:Uncharacterized protein n=1 Tax=Paramecium octaurelia TaxID=43137 RepID=A0A8S1TSW2_PAROT|nr:unnamed protein product [Paramecium octaurelia]
MLFNLKKTIYCQQLSRSLVYTSISKQFELQDRVALQILCQGTLSKNTSKQILNNLSKFKIQKQAQTKYCQHSFDYQQYNPVGFGAQFILVGYIERTYIAERNQQQLQNLFSLEFYQYNMEKHCSGNIQGNKFYLLNYLNFVILTIATYTKQFQQQAKAHQKY